MMSKKADQILGRDFHNFVWLLVYLCLSQTRELRVPYLPVIIELRLLQLASER